MGTTTNTPTYEAIELLVGTYHSSKSKYYELLVLPRQLGSEVSSVKDSFKSIERIFILAVAVFIFGKPVMGGIKDVFDEAKEA